MDNQEKAANHAEAARALKKIIAAKGRLQGNFYFAGDAAGKLAGLIVTLSGKDKSGQKALAAGKGLRKSIPGAKFARGIVTMDDNKLSFEQQSGSAGPATMKKAFKGALVDAQQGGTKDLKLLAKAAIRQATPEGEEIEAGEALGDLDQALLSDGALSAGELEDLQREQGNLRALNQQLRQSFSSAEDAAREEQEMLQSSLEGLRQLDERIAAADPDSEEAAALQAERQRQRRDLAASLYTGPDPFPEVGQPLDEATTALLRSSVERAHGLLDAAIDAMSQQLLAYQRSQRGGDQAALRQIRVDLPLFLRNLDAYQTQLDALLA